VTDQAVGASDRVIGSPGGLVIVDKPPGWTSHDVVARCRKVFGTRKVGHAGTLDPDATGVLVLGVGTVTRLLRFLSGLTKSYTAEVVLGVATNTLDSSGEVTGRWDMGSVSLAQVRAAAATLTGTIDQVPPMVSALHVGGQRLHQLARAGIEVDRPARTVTVTRFDVAGPLAAPFANSPDAGPSEGGPGVPGGGPSDRGPGVPGGGPSDGGPGCGPDGRRSGPVFAISVDCSAGTYIRSLAADLGTILGGGAHLRNLRRTAVGRFAIEQATPLEVLTPDALLPPMAALAGMAAVQVDAEVAVAVGHGKVLGAAELGVDQAGPSRHGGPWAVIDASGELLAVYQPYGDGRVKPAVVLAQPGS